MLRVIRQLWVFSRFISEIQSSPAAPGYRQSRHKRRNSGTCWLTPAYKNARKEKAGVRDRRRSQKLNSALKRANLDKMEHFVEADPKCPETSTSFDLGQSAYCALTHPG